VTPELAGSRIRCTSVARPVGSQALASKYVLQFIDHIPVVLTRCLIEPWLGQGPSSQPHTCSVDLEEAQHPQPPSLPVITWWWWWCPGVFYIFMFVFCTLRSCCSHARYGCMYSLELSQKTNANQIYSIHACFCSFSSQAIHAMICGRCHLSGSLLPPWFVS
jgi:hypothetical protein